MIDLKHGDFSWLSYVRLLDGTRVWFWALLTSNEVRDEGSRVFGSRTRTQGGVRHQRGQNWRPLLDPRRSIRSDPTMAFVPFYTFKNVSLYWVKWWEVILGCQIFRQEHIYIYWNCSVRVWPKMNVLTRILLVVCSVCGSFSRFWVLS